MRLKGKKAIVTGGSRGIGKAIVEKLASEGADVAFLYVSNESAAIETLQEASKSGSKVKYYRCDVSVLEEVIQTVKAILNDFGDIDILVNNAGVIKDKVIYSMTEQDYDVVLDTNLKGAFNMIKACYYTFIHNRKGKIINISSVTGIGGNIGQANYAAAKAGMIGLTKAVAKELGPRNVCCNAVAPGVIKTAMTEGLDLDEKNKETISLRRIGTPEDVANVVLFFASEESNYVTGQVIKVDGNLVI